MEKSELILCRWCGVVPEGQKIGRFRNLAGKVLDPEELARLVGSFALAVVMAALLGPAGGIVGAILAVKDREMNYAMIPCPTLATGNVLENVLDLRHLGVNPTDRYGIRIFKIELAGRASWVTGLTADRRIYCWLRTIVTGNPAGTLVPLTSDGMIATWDYRLEWEAAAGGHQAVLEENGVVYPEGLLIASANLYFGVDNAGGGNISPGLRIWYKREKLSDADYREVWEVWERA